MTMYKLRLVAILFFSNLAATRHEIIEANFTRLQEQLKRGEETEDLLVVHTAFKELMDQNMQLQRAIRHLERANNKLRIFQELCMRNPEAVDAAIAELRANNEALNAQFETVAQAKAELRAGLPVISDAEQMATIRTANPGATDPELIAKIVNNTTFLYKFMREDILRLKDFEATNDSIKSFLRDIGCSEEEMAIINTNQNIKLKLAELG